jgi:hypothetical protein
MYNRQTRSSLIRNVKGRDRRKMDHGWRGLKGKAIPVTNSEGPEGCETSRLPHILDSWLTDGVEVVS